MYEGIPCLCQCSPATVADTAERLSYLPCSHARQTSANSGKSQQNVYSLDTLGTIIFMENSHEEDFSINFSLCSYYLS